LGIAGLQSWKSQTRPRFIQQQGDLSTFHRRWFATGPTTSLGMECPLTTTSTPMRQSSGGDAQARRGATTRSLVVPNETDGRLTGALLTITSRLLYGGVLLAARDATIFRRKCYFCFRWRRRFR
jgi:hypothetical protein